MSFEKVFEALKQGCCIRRTIWPITDYLYLEPYQVLFYHTKGLSKRINGLSIVPMLMDDWEIDTYQTGSKVAACLHYADTHPTEKVSKKFISLYKDFKMSDITK